MSTRGRTRTDTVPCFEHGASTDWATRAQLPSLDSNQDLEVQSLAGFQLPHRALRAADHRSTAWCVPQVSNLHLLGFNEALCHLSLERVEGPAGIEPARRPWRGRMQPEHLSPAAPDGGAGRGTRTLVLSLTRRPL